ncbi:FecR domain-containing protein [Nodosilinea sp. LEGE 07088]|uniref:FecR domain-containing protein n=1 Tax=Nodosilinea sp. LEGE 07088 TaxID=2777968 RepID=UPI00188096F1|nr:FecR domain-containing protein [Nodosilinea sp. LEGE 07088]MBE9137649.1 FecR domain-containing protein [Nodosilinea sp. LEGE 07088]
MYSLPNPIAPTVNLRAFALPLLLVIGVMGCQATPPPAPLPGDSTTTVTDDAAANIATIQAIVAEPVSVTLGQNAPAPAQLNQALAYGDRIRTVDQALAEVGLETGPVFRIGGDATLTLQPNQLVLNTGQMITWVEGKAAEPVEIVTPAGIAGIRGTTVFVNIIDAPAAPIEIFSWEGEVAFRLPGSAEEIVLNSGEQLFITPGEQDIASLRQRVQTLDRATALQRLENSELINGFNRPIPTRDAIEATVEELQ